jgi:Fe-S oxidoreductase
MASYKALALHRRFRRRLRPRSHYSLGWLPRWARLASRAPSPVNRVLASRLTGPALRRLAGVDTGRALPRFAGETFHAWWRREGRGWYAAPDGRLRVTVFVDTFSDAFSPDVPRSAFRTLWDAGYAPEPSAEGLCCGLTWISTGQLDAARRRVRRTVSALDPRRVGAPDLVVGLEPSCTAVLRSDACELLPDDDAATAVSTHIRTLAELLAATPGWTPPDLTGLDVVAQPHCHHHAVMGWSADADLLRQAGAAVTRVGGCCGLAGNFGVEAGHGDLSRAIAGQQLLPAAAAHEEAIVLGDGFSCRTQLAELAGRSGIHLAQLLADGIADGIADGTVDRA